MDDPDRLEAKGLARAKVRAKRRRVQTIRRRALRGSLALFAVAWAIIFAQLASGNDPALSQSTRHAVKRAVATTKPKPTPETEEFVPEPEPEVEVEPEPAPEPEPEPIITSAS